MRVFLFSLILFAGPVSSSFADTLEGRLVSIDAGGRMLTIDSGETMRLTELIPMEGLAIGQLLRLEFQEGTADVTSLLVLEEAPPPAGEEPIVEDAAQ